MPITHAGNSHFMKFLVLFVVLLTQCFLQVSAFGCANVDANGEVTIPAYVTSIGNIAFQDCINLITVSFETGSQLTSIGNYAFSGSGLKTITLPPRLASIGLNAFYLAKDLQSISFPASLTSISQYAFTGSGLTSVTLPAVTSIGINAFFGVTSLTSITIPASVTSIGQYAFSGCSALTTVIYGSSSSTLAVDVGAFAGTPYASNGRQVSGRVVVFALECALNVENGSLNVPASVTSISASAFQGCSALNSVSFAAGSKLTSIGQLAFQNTAITSIALPISVRTISAGAFASTTALTSVQFACSPKALGIDITAFDGSSISQLELPPGATYTGTIPTIPMMRCATAGNYYDAGMPAPAPCPGGTYCPSYGLTSATRLPCKVSYYCPVGATAPSLCIPGGYCPAGSTFPTPCDAGSYCPNYAMSAPTPCSAGNYCPVGSVQPTVCPAGNYCPNLGMGFPIECPAGYYCSAGSSAPKPCPCGTYSSSSGNVAVSNCVSCPITSYMSLGSSGQAGAYACSNTCPDSTLSTASMAYPLPCGVDSCSVSAALSSSAAAISKSNGTANASIVLAVLALCAVGYVVYRWVRVNPSPVDIATSGMKMSNVMESQGSTGAPKGSSSVATELDAKNARAGTNPLHLASRPVHSL